MFRFIIGLFLVATLFAFTASPAAANGVVFVNGQQFQQILLPDGTITLQPTGAILSQSGIVVSQFGSVLTPLAPVVAFNSFGSTTAIIGGRRTVFFGGRSAVFIGGRFGRFR